MERFPDWPDRLVAFIEDRRFTPFTWGQNDCCLFAADSVLAITGVDLAKEWRGKYNDAKEAAKVLHIFEGSIEKVVDGLNVLERIPLGKEQRGDIVAVENKGRVCLGIVLGEQFVAVGDNGLEFSPLRESKVVAIWKV